MYDEVLFGPAPEAAVTITHQAIRALLLSDEGKKFLSLSQEDDSDSVTFCDEFVKKNRWQCFSHYSHCFEE